MLINILSYTEHSILETKMSPLKVPRMDGYIFKFLFPTKASQLMELELYIFILFYLTLFNFLTLAYFYLLNRKCHTIAYSQTQEYKLLNLLAYLIKII